MHTLIELFDERPFENVIATLVFRPARTIFVCPPQIARDTHLHELTRQLLLSRGVTTATAYVAADTFSAQDTARALSAVLAEAEDAAIDITGGTDAALYAAGQVTALRPVPVFTYSRRRGCFFSVRDAAFAEGVPCDIELTIDDYFLMAGGSTRPGRVDNAVLAQYLPLFDPFFDVFLQNRAVWPRFVSWMQRASAPLADGTLSLHVDAPRSLKGDHGRMTEAPEAVLKGLEAAALISNLILGDTVCFDMPDAQIRTWLRDVGSVLELYVYKHCLDTRLFREVRTSVVAEWENGAGSAAVTNEIDVIASRGVVPLFISCKTCDARTEALNELAILRDRFGGRMACAAIVTAENASAPLRRRAEELDIAVIDVNDLLSGDIDAALLSAAGKP